MDLKAVAALLDHAERSELATSGTLITGGAHKDVIFSATSYSPAYLAAVIAELANTVAAARRNDKVQPEAEPPEATQWDRFESAECDADPQHVAGVAIAQLQKRVDAIEGKFKQPSPKGNLEIEVERLRAQNERLTIALCAAVTSKDVY